MRRRDFIKAVAGSSVAWSLAARAQQTAMPVIGFLRSTSLADATRLVTAFRQGLKEAGFVEGQNVGVEYRSAEDRPDRLPALVADLISQQVAVIVGNNNAQSRPRQRLRPSRSSSRAGVTRSEMVSSAASTGRVAMSPAWPFSPAAWARSDWTCCGSSRRRRP